MSSVQPWEPGPGKAAAGPEQRGTSLQPLSCGKLNTLWSQETNAENSPDEDVHVYIVYRGMCYLTDTEGLYNKTLLITLSEITTRTNYGTQIRLSCVLPLRAVEVACSSGLRQRDTWEYAAQPRPACTWAQSRGECGERGRIPEQQRLADTVIYFIACCLARVRGKTVVWCLSRAEE